MEAVVFDLDGVYFEGGTEKFIALLQEKYGLAEDAIKEVYLRSQEMKDLKEGKMTDEDFWKHAIHVWNIEATRPELLQLLANSYKENPETLKLITDLRSKGVKTAVCTNNFSDRIETLNKKFHFKKNFDVFITSYEEGITKPNPEIFHILAQRLGLAPAQIVMSDDREVNVEALQKLGFQAFLYKGLDDFKARVA
jgi:epoxide hydrolase-like predicted phosphatase